MKSNLPSRKSTPRVWGSLFAVTLSLAASANAAVISSVVETGGDNEATDTIVAQFTGQTWNVSVANEPFPGAAVGSPYTVGTFGNFAPAFVDRAHRYMDDPGTTPGFQVQPIPAYLIGNEYIMSGNDNRDNASYNLSVSLTGAARVFMLIDNRLQDGDNLTPPTFGPANMQWIVDDGWLGSNNGLNRFANPGVPDEVPIDEGADGTVNQWYSVYYKDFAGGTFNLFQADNAGRNMYGVVIAPIPEPATASFAGLAIAGLLLRRRRM